MVYELTTYIWLSFTQIMVLEYLEKKCPEIQETMIELFENSRGFV